MLMPDVTIKILFQFYKIFSVTKLHKNELLIINFYFQLSLILTIVLKSRHDKKMQINQIK
jgi:hypothetical protein